MPVEGKRLVDLLSLSTHSLTIDGVGATAALFAGVASSAHCALMCGPLACAAGDRPASDHLIALRKPRRAEPLAYHFGRVGSYALVGAVLGTVGEGARRAFAGVAPVLPWVMASALVATSLGWSKRLPLPGPLKRLAQPLIRKAANLAPLARSAAIGAATPLLPCAILYGLFLAAIAASSTLGGAGVMAAFAVGATPALALVQAHAPLLSRFPRAVTFVRRAVPLLAAVVLVWRAVHAGGDLPPRCH
jgi:sulfite exporter TauE/SafE